MLPSLLLAGFLPSCLQSWYQHWFLLPSPYSPFINFSLVGSVSLSGTSELLFAGSSTAFGVSSPGLDYVSHEDILPYSSTDQVPIQHELFERFLMYDQTKGNFCPLR